MKRLIIICLLILPLPAFIYAQALTPPEFPGGENAFHAFLTKNLKWPDKNADALGIVTIGLTVEKDGQLTNIHVAKSLSPKFDKEALRVINLSPNWIPARKNHTFIKSNYSIPISFELKPVDPKELQVSAGHQADVVIDEPMPGADANDPPDKIYTSVEKAPQFSGGMGKFYDYVQQSLKDEKITAADEGKVVITFVAERDGSLTDIKIARSVSEKSDGLALKIIKNSPKWIPGIRNGRPVRVSYAVPVNIKSNI